MSTITEKVTSLYQIEYYQDNEEYDTCMRIRPANINKLFEQIGKDLGKQDLYLDALDEGSYILSALIYDINDNLLYRIFLASDNVDRNVIEVFDEVTNENYYLIN